MGVEFRQARSRHGRLRSNDLEREFDFIFIGVGLGAMERLGIPGEDLPGVIDALRFIERYKTLPRFPGRPRASIVIGGGNTAIDAANAARAPGRRGRPPLLPPQRNRDAGLPVRVRSLQGRRRALPLAGAARRDRRTRRPRGRREVRRARDWARPMPSGRRMPEPIPGSEFAVACDMVIPALGQSRLTAVLQPWKSNGGSIVVDRADRPHQQSEILRRRRLRERRPRSGGRGGRRQARGARRSAALAGGDSWLT